MRSNSGLHPIPFYLERQHKSTEMQIGELTFLIVQTKGQKLSKATDLPSRRLQICLLSFLKITAFFSKSFLSLYLSNNMTLKHLEMKDHVHENSCKNFAKYNISLQKRLWCHIHKKPQPVVAIQFRVDLTK